MAARLRIMRAPLPGTVIDPFATGTGGFGMRLYSIDEEAMPLIIIENL